MCIRSAIHTIIVELHYKLHSKLMQVICTVNNIGLAGLFSECIYRTPTTQTANRNATSTRRATYMLLNPDLSVNCIHNKCSYVPE